MGAMLGEQPKSCKRYAMNSTRAHLYPVNTTASRPPPECTTDTGKRHKAPRQQLTACTVSHSVQP